MKFPFQYDETIETPLWLQLRQRLTYLIESGYFKPGDQLPTVRALATDLSINYNTVNKAYLSLAADGYIESTRGRGAFVRELAVDSSEESQKELEEVLDDCIQTCLNLGLTYDDIQQCMARRIKHQKRQKGLDSESADNIVEVDIKKNARRGRAGA